MKKLQVSVGHTELEFGADLVNVEKIIVHPQFLGTSGNNDITLLLLASPLRYNKITVPICLPPGAPYQPEDWKTCYITGWGTTVSGKPRTLRYWCQGHSFKLMDLRSGLLISDILSIPSLVEVSVVQ